MKYFFCLKMKKIKRTHIFIQNFTNKYSKINTVTEFDSIVVIRCKF
jgi:hypothetical protein